jgi:flagellar biosynthesis/type III secretory pathway protein FliH
MTTPSAKDLLAQADELIRRTRAPADLPVLTELVTETPRSKPTSRLAASVEGIPDLTELIETPAKRDAGDTLEVEEISFEEFKREALNERREPSLGLDDSAPAMHEIFPSQIKAFADASQRSASALRSDGDNTATYTKAQFETAVAAKLEQMQHSVYSQVMQQLELHATGEMKRNLREALEPALTQVALDLAAQVAEETSIQMQQIISNAVENEVARLREQILNKRRDNR